MLGAAPAAILSLAAPAQAGQVSATSVPGATTAVNCVNVTNPGMPFSGVAAALICGDNATGESLGNSTTIGNNASAAVGSTVIGNAANGSGTTGSVLIGDNAFASGYTNVGIGQNANVLGYNSVAVGSFAITIAPDSVAIGQLAGVDTGAVGGVAVGRAAAVLAANSVAIGANSIANAANSVSFGTAGSERTLVNVAAGTVSATSTDAVNGSQLHAVQQSIASISAGGLTAAQLNQLNAATSDIASVNQTVASLNQASTANIGIDNAQDAEIARLDTQYSTLATQVTNLTQTPAAGPSGLAQNFASVSPAATGANAIGNASAGADSSVAIGDGAVATGGAAVSIGLGNEAQGNGAVAIGDPNFANGTGAVALGANNNAQGDGAIGIGNQNTAVGISAVALGQFATANGNEAVAIGNNASATAAGAVALGANATATQANQIKLGGTGSSIAIGDVAATSAAQTGATAILTVDASGTVGHDTTIRPTLATLTAGQASLAAVQTTQGSQIGALATAQATQGAQIQSMMQLQGQQTAQIDRLFTDARRDRRDTNRGLASIAAMTPASMPSAPGATSYTANTSVYRGQVGFGVSLAHRMDTDNPFAVTAGASYAGGRTFAGRILRTLLSDVYRQLCRTDIWCPMNAAEATLYCIRCRCRLSRARMAVDILDEPGKMANYPARQPLINAGQVVQSAIPAPWINRSTCTILGSKPQFWLNPDDVTDAVEDRSDGVGLNGCCGPTGLSGGNQQCRRCSAVVGILQDDCITPRVFIPDPATTCWEDTDDNFLPW
ncbi:hypothetical protein [Novosphingobium sp. B1]|uniref:hypothetical protein n=1 Tax=Novosphingobium sp. B1 TaxID=1938756 RepID=UPI0009D7E0A8|nr:hypothetical protein [Novosphingobium sp. B1]SMD03389.1 Head domain of trimeric autotransporter adhesin [Novosphingobium sp. B1]